MVLWWVPSSNTTQNQRVILTDAIIVVVEVSCAISSNFVQKILIHVIRFLSDLKCTCEECYHVNSFFSLINKNKNAIRSNLILRVSSTLHTTPCKVRGYCFSRSSLLVSWSWSHGQCGMTLTIAINSTIPQMCKHCDGLCDHWRRTMYVTSAISSYLW